MNITDGIPSEIYVAIGRDRYSDEYEVARETAAAVREESAAELAALRSQLAAERQLKEAAEAREEGLLQHLQHLVDDLDGMCPDSIWQGWWDKTAALLAPAAEEGAGDGN